MHFTSAYYADPGFYSEDNSLYKNYVGEFQNEPSEYAIKGFDLMMFFGRLLQNYGTRYGDMIGFVRDAGIHTHFSFGANTVEDGATTSLDSVIVFPKTDFIENKYVHLLKYENYSVKKVD